MKTHPKNTIFVFYGSEGSGKTTQAKLLAEALKVKYISTGNMVRYFSQKDRGVLGQACRDILSKGIYLSDKHTCQMVKNRLSQKDLNNGFVLDGFPRNTYQAGFLCQLLAKQDKKITVFFYLKVSRETAIGRLTKRNRDSFDSLEKIESRLNQYYQEETKTLQYFQKKGILTKVNGDQPIKKISTQILNAIKN